MPLNIEVTKDDMTSDEKLTKNSVSVLLYASADDSHHLTLVVVAKA